MTAGLALVLREVHDGEAALEEQLRVVAERHRTDHEVRHVAVDLARWSLQNRRDLAPFADRYGHHLAGEQEPQSPSRLLGALRERSAELLGRQPAPGLLLLHDLRALHLMATGNSVLWTMVGQAAQATRSADLLEVVTACHGRTTRQATWCNAMVKALSPQVLSAV